MYIFLILIENAYREFRGNHEFKNLRTHGGIEFEHPSGPPSVHFVLFRVLLTFRHQHVSSNIPKAQRTLAEFPVAGLCYIVRAGDLHCLNTVFPHLPN